MISIFYEMSLCVYKKVLYIFFLVGEVGNDGYGLVNFWLLHFSGFRTHQSLRHCFVISLGRISSSSWLYGFGFDYYSFLLLWIFLHFRLGAFYFASSVLEIIVPVASIVLSVSVVSVAVVIECVIVSTPPFSKGFAVVTLVLGASAALAVAGWISRSRKMAHALSNLSCPHPLIFK